MSFQNYSLPQLKSIVKKFRDYHDIKGYSKMNREQLVDALDDKFRILDNKLYLHNSAEVKLPEVKNTQNNKQLNAMKSKLLKLQNRTETLFHKMTIIDQFLEQNNLKEKQKQTKLKQLKKMGDEYMKLSKEIYAIEDTMDTQPKEHLNKVVEDVKIVDEKNEEPKKNFTEKENLMMNLMHISGQIKKLKNDITFEIYEPAIAKLNKKIDDLKVAKQKFNKQLENLKKK